MSKISSTVGKNIHAVNEPLITSKINIIMAWKCGPGCINSSYQRRNPQDTLQALDLAKIEVNWTVTRALEKIAQWEKYNRLSFKQQDVTLFGSRFPVSKLPSS